MTVSPGQSSLHETNPPVGRPFAIFAARVVMFWERLWPALLPALAPIFLFFVLSLFDMWRHVSPVMHWAAIALTAGGTAIALRWGWRDVNMPERAAALKRLEEDGAVSHAALRALEDAPFDGDAEDPFWRAHLEAMRRLAADARLGKPHATADQVDPFSLRFGAIGLAFVALSIAGDDSGRRIADAFQPRALGQGRVAVADIWVEPPDYTGRAPIYLLRAAEALDGVRAQINAPEGSVVIAQLNTSRSDDFVFETPDGEISAERDDDGARARIKIEQSGLLKLRLAGETGAWPIGVIPDTAPFVEFLETPSATDDARLAISVRIEDDYGAAAATLRLRLKKDQNRPLDAPDFDRKALEEAREIELSGFEGIIGERTFSLDLQSDPWAGLQVEATLIVVDGAGQRAETETLDFALPARLFYNPLAKSVIEQRRNLAVAAQDWRRAGRAFDALTLAPEAFYEDTTDYLLMRTAFRRVLREGDEGDFDDAVEEFWPLALQLEDKALELARRRLEAAEAALREALERGASDEEVASLVEALREAMNQYLQALAQSGAPQPSANGQSQQIEEGDLDAMLDQIRDLAQSGAQNAARQALSDLENILNNLRLSGRSGQGSPGQGQPGQGQPGDGGQSGGAGEAGDLIGRQRDLANRTYRRGLDPNATGDALSGEQSDLAGDLGALREELSQRSGGAGDPDPSGEAATAFDEAAREMRRAEQALSADNFAAANTAMERAIDALRDGAETLAETAGERARQARGQNQGEAGPAYDPLGRPVGAARGPNEIDVPDEAGFRRARDVMREIRRRLSDGERSEEEIEYLERLLERF